MCIYLLTRALDKREHLVIIRDKYSIYFLLFKC